MVLASRSDIPHFPSKIGAPGLSDEYDRSSSLGVATFHSTSVLSGDRVGVRCSCLIGCPLPQPGVSDAQYGAVSNVLLCGELNVQLVSRGALLILVQFWGCLSENSSWFMKLRSTYCWMLKSRWWRRLRATRDVKQQHVKAEQALNKQEKTAAVLLPSNRIRHSDCFRSAVVGCTKLHKYKNISGGNAMIVCACADLWEIYNNLKIRVI